jgi:hypothetical protein
MHLRIMFCWEAIVVDEADVGGLFGAVCAIVVGKKMRASA